MNVNKININQSEPTYYIEPGVYVETNEFIEATTDAEGKLLGGRTPDGVAFENVGFATPNVSIDGHIIENIEDIEGRCEITTDGEGKIISYRDRNGIKHEEIVKINSAIINHLNFTTTGMTEFQQALKDTGFQSGGGDWSDKTSMCIKKPRLAYLNILSDVNLSDLTKEGFDYGVHNVPILVEFNDNEGNYFKKYALISGQGRSSMYFPKKGLALDFFNENPSDASFNEENTFVIRFGDWVPQDSFHIKSYYTDFTRCTGSIVYQLTEEVAKTRGILADRPYKKYYTKDYTDIADSTTPSNLEHNIEMGGKCIPDGFPVIVYQKGIFWGVNSWQLKKHRGNYQMDKEDANHIHLDGVYQVGSINHNFFMWNGSIDWAQYTSGVNGIETRNPKNLYCIDGKKYDADSHDAEIITSEIAEEWISAGVIEPTGKVIDSKLAKQLRTTGKVRASLEEVTTYVPYIQSLINGRASISEIKAAIEARFDVDSFIDYILVTNVCQDTDAWINNAQFTTWGKIDYGENSLWSVNKYDCDCSFGNTFEGRFISPASNVKLGLENPPFNLIWSYYDSELKARYKELRDAKIFDADHIINMFRDWMNRVGYENYAMEYKRWSQSPCFRDGTKEYPIHPTTGGFYGSIYRIYNWVKKRIEYMDASDFFNYNN